MDIASTVLVVGRLKKFGKSLHHVDVIDAANVQTRVAVPKLRTKWKQLERDLDGLGWRSLRAKDKDDALLIGGDFELICDEPDLEETELEELELPAELEVSYLFAERVANLCLNAQKVALATQRQQMASLLDGHSKLAGVLTDRLIALEKMRAADVKLLRAAALTTGNGDSDEELLSGGSVLEMLGMLMAQHKATEHAAKSAAAAANGTPPPPKNGEPKG